MKGNLIFGLAFLVVSLFALTAMAGSSTGTATLFWSAPTTNTDGSPYTDPGGYNIYLHAGTGYTKIGTTPATGLTYVDNVSVPNNTKISRCYVVTAFDTSNLESGYSNEVCKNFEGADTLAPSAPANLTIQ